MNTQTPPPSSLQFGIEIELLLGGRKKAFSSWKALASDLSKRLTQAGIANRVHDDAKGLESYEKWTIVREVTVPNQPAKGLWGIELVSPVYPSTWWYWATELELLFATLKGAFALAPSPHCSTHVHVSGTPAPLPAAALAALARAALYYEAALDQLVPPERRASSAYWCQSIRASPGLRGLPLGTCLTLLEAVDAMAPASSSSSPSYSYGGGGGGGGGLHSRQQLREDWEAQDAAVRALVEAINLFPAASAYGKAHGKKKDFVRGKVYKWDFSGMLASSSSSASSSAGPRGTVEFRQAPGCRSAEDAKGWVSVVLSLVACATRPPFAEGLRGGGLSKAGGSLEELWGVLGSGAELLGWDGVGAAGQIFAKRTA